MLSQCSDHSPPSQSEIRVAGEGNHSLYGTLCLLVSLLFLALSPCHLLVPGNTAGKRLAHLQLLSLCMLPKVQSSMSVTSLKETHTHTWLGAKQHQGHQQCVDCLMLGMCESALCVCMCAMEEDPLCPFLSGLSSVLKGLFMLSSHWFQQSLGFLQADCSFRNAVYWLYRRVSFHCVVCPCSEKCASLYCYLFSDKLFLKLSRLHVVSTV